MRPNPRGLAAACALLAIPFAVRASADLAPVTEVVTRSLPLGDARTVEVDNVFGSVRVRAGAAGRVEVKIHQTIRAETAEALAAARREVVLEVYEEDGRLELVQGGPFRDDDCERRCGEDDGAGRHRRHHWDPDYEVEWRWEVTVPATVALEASTVNGGDLEVTGVTGEVEAANVNGAVRLAGLGGRASASTVNGELSAEFTRALDAPAEFTTVNGDVSLTFPRGFGAELEFSTLHGDVYTDFDFDSSPVPARVERDGGRWRVGRETVVRLGGGGPRLACTTVNGDVLIRER
jgi:hypothetical protein